MHIHYSTQFLLRCEVAELDPRCVNIRTAEMLLLSSLRSGLEIFGAASTSGNLIRVVSEDDSVPCEGLDVGC